MTLHRVSDRFRILYRMHVLASEKGRTGTSINYCTFQVSGLRPALIVDTAPLSDVIISLSSSSRVRWSWKAARACVRPPVRETREKKESESKRNGVADLLHVFGVHAVLFCITTRRKPAGRQRRTYARSYYYIINTYSS